LLLVVVSNPNRFLNKDKIPKSKARQLLLFLYLYRNLKSIPMTPGGVAVIVVITMIGVLIALFGDMLKSKN